MMPTRFFRTHGQLCANHPLEVIVATLTLTACLLTIDYHTAKPTHLYCPDCGHETDTEFRAVDVIAMTLIRCLALLYTYYQFCTLQKLDSKYILAITALFTVFCSFVFTTTLLNFLQMNVSDLKDALFFFMLLIDLSKAAVLAQFALSGGNRQEVKSNIAAGLETLGPIVTLDTIVETLLISVGTLSGVERLETLACVACLSVLVNYLVFMTFYPACLSLMLELSVDARNTHKLPFAFDDHRTHPILHRIKIMMAIGLVVVHVHSRCLLVDASSGGGGGGVLDRLLHDLSEHAVRAHLMRWLTLSLDHVVILILLMALIAKFALFGSKEHISELYEQLERKKQRTIYVNQAVQVRADDANDAVDLKLSRGLSESLKIYREDRGAELNDADVMLLVKSKYIPLYQIEKAVGSAQRGVRIRRKILGEVTSCQLTDLPYLHYDYEQVLGVCCENVIGYVPVPVGMVGPLLVDGQTMYVPMATTEGCLVASTNRGSRALLENGVTSRIVADGMTRGPVVRFASVDEASRAILWLHRADNFARLKAHFDATSRFARLTKINAHIAGRYIFIRFVATTGDAMGMNMLSKGTESSLKLLKAAFPQMELLSLSGNFCADKKPSALNWIEGRGKSVVCEAIVPARIVADVLKTSVHGMIDVNVSKNMVGSSMAGSIGGFNAHAANLVTAIYIATGQDPAQNVSSSNCMTLMEPWGESGNDLYISCTMPSVEVGTIGGGTALLPQAACLELLGVRGPNATVPGQNADRLARIVCATVLAGELSLIAALAAGHLVKSHLSYNRSRTTVSALNSSGGDN